MTLNVNAACSVVHSHNSFGLESLHSLPMLAVTAALGNDIC